MRGNRKDGRGGYGNPPRHTRFQKGRSGNPRGRPKGAKNFTTLLAKKSAEKVKFSKNGPTMSKLEAALQQLMDRAAAGDPKCMHQLFVLKQWAEGRTESLAPATESLSDADREVIAHIHARLKLYDQGDDNE
jgi:Family of unknown function (DUF5681)